MFVATWVCGLTSALALVASFVVSAQFAALPHRPAAVSEPPIMMTMMMMMMMMTNVYLTHNGY